MGARVGLFMVVDVVPLADSLALPAGGWSAARDACVVSLDGTTPPPVLALLPEAEDVALEAPLALVSVSAPV